MLHPGWYPPTVVSSPLGISIVEVPPAASSSTAVGFSSPYTHGVSSESNPAPLLDGPALSSGHIVSPLVSHCPHCVTSHGLGPILHLPGFYLFRLQSQPVYHRLPPRLQCSLGWPRLGMHILHVHRCLHGAPVSTSSGCTLVSGTPLPTPRVLPTVSES